MVITAVDRRNMVVVIDQLQAKYLVEVLRQTTEQQQKDALIEMNKDGWRYNSVDAVSAIANFISVAGFITDQLVLAPRENNEEGSNEVKVEPTPKHLVN